MKLYNHVIVRRPCKAMVEGLDSGTYPGKPEYELALTEHNKYISALSKCGVDVTILSRDENYPDSCFVEDPAIVTKDFAIVTNPADPSRNGEKHEIVDALLEFYTEDQIEHIEAPGTLEGGDVQQVGTHFFVGEGARTNKEGIRQLTEIAEKHGMTCSAVPVKNILHLKDDICYLDNNVMLVSEAQADHPAFADFDKIVVPDEEFYAINCLWMNDTVIVPAGYPKTLAAVQEHGFKTVVLDTSEYRKIDGSLTCLSLRF